MWVEITRQAWSSVVTFGTECSKREFTELYVRYYYEANGCHLVAINDWDTGKYRYYIRDINT